MRSLPAILAVNSICVTQASAIDFFVDAGMSLKLLEFNAQSSDGLTDYTLSPVFTMLSVTGGIAVQRFYLTANVERSLFDAELEDAVNPGDKDTLSRSDNSVTLGFYIKNNLSIFAGYLTGKTEDEYSSPSIEETGEISFSEKGPFAGVNYLLLFSKGAVSLNFAYAFLDGEYEQSWKNNQVSGYEKYKGDTSGVSVGAKYVGQWTKQLNYYAGGKVNLFKFDSEQFDTEENFYIAQAGVTYKF